MNELVDLTLLLNSQGLMSDGPGAVNFKIKHIYHVVQCIILYEGSAPTDQWKYLGVYKDDISTCLKTV